MHANDSLRQTVSTDFNDNKVAPSATVPRWTRRLSCWSRGSPTEEVLLLWGSSAGFEEEMGLPDLLSDSAHGPSLDSRSDATGVPGPSGSNSGRLRHFKRFFIGGHA
jgi:hypothetical protein